MIVATLNHLNLFPTWLQNAILVLLGLVVIAVLTGSLIKALQTPPMQTLFRGLRSSCLWFAHYLAEQMKDPIEYPRVARMFQYFDIAFTYVMSGLLAVIAVSFAIFAALAYTRLSLESGAALYSYILLCLCVAAVLKAQGGRARIKLRTSAPAI
jgi:hypothetical protein